MFLNNKILLSQNVEVKITEDLVSDNLTFILT